MRRSRLWLTLVYGLATLLAQGLHDHDGRRGDEVASAAEGCDDARVHVSAHGGPDLGIAPDACPACQLRGEHALGQFAPIALDRPVVGLPPVPACVPSPARLASRPTGRSPPRV